LCRESNRDGQDPDSPQQRSQVEAKLVKCGGEDQHKDRVVGESPKQFRPVRVEPTAEYAGDAPTDGVSDEEPDSQYERGADDAEQSRSCQDL
jgi:hypothetical protein